jgi:hypothetical protein
MSCVHPSWQQATHVSQTPSSSLEPRNVVGSNPMDSAACLDGVYSLEETLNTFLNAALVRIPFAGCPFPQPNSTVDVDPDSYFFPDPQNHRKHGGSEALALRPLFLSSAERQLGLIVLELSGSAASEGHHCDPYRLQVTPWVTHPRQRPMM